MGSRGISEVEQTDIQVRLQELWRDRREEVERGVGKLEEEYEHHLTESSTEISELEGSIRGKQAAIAKLQGYTIRIINIYFLKTSGFKGLQA